MGLIIIDETNTGGKKVEIDTVSCCHCQAIIKIYNRLVRGANNTKHRCRHCRKPICKHCATALKGVCSPIQDKCEQAVKSGVWGWFNPYRINCEARSTSVLVT
jgi:hypothetical protein